MAYGQLYLPDEDNADDEYLTYTSIDDLMERFYFQRGEALRNALAYPEKNCISKTGTPISDQKPEYEDAASNKKISIVHGHNGEVKESVARFVEKLGFQAIILHECPNKGRTIITKFREESQGVSFAVVLMTPDDEGKAIGASNLSSRARQNVVFELGFFIGKLGPGRVAALVKGSIEKPSDFDGVVYISLDQDWKIKLASEFKAAGLDGDWSKVLS